ncbi:hypothetical protein LOD99_11611 [Oopsacas minuta]|uniref:Uncharacterized protein n=1 Tax=Oopsacas minuta TaxID=111878 RepID=A0AAV7JK59_9METZ|nr:hypothetical protein LOD99_11611 [Oopsacas minuta]
MTILKRYSPPLYLVTNHPYLFITPICNRSLTKGENNKDVVTPSTDSKAEELSVSLDALGIARRAENNEQNKIFGIETQSSHTTDCPDTKSPTSTTEIKSPISFRR